MSEHEHSPKEDPATITDAPDEAAPGESEIPAVPLIELREISVREQGLLLAALTGLLIIFRFDGFRFFFSEYIGGFSGDGGLYVWLVQHNLRDLFSLPWFNTYAFYPYGKAIAWSDNFIFPSLLAGIFLWIGVPLVAVYNGLILAATALNGIITARLCSRLTGNSLSAFIGGAAFMCSSVLSSSVGHPQLQFAFWIPLGTLVVIEFLAKPSSLTALAFGITLLLTFLTTVHFALFIFVVVFALVGCIVLVRPHALTKKHAILFVSGTCVGLIPIVPFVGPYLEASATFQSRALYEAYYFSASILSYLSAGEFSLLFGRTIRWSHNEARLFPGLLMYVATVIAILRLVEARQLRQPVIIFAALFGLTGLASLLPAHAVTKAVCALLLWATLAAFCSFIYRMGKLERSLKVTFLTNRALIAMFLGVALLGFALSFGPLGNPEKGHLALGVFRFFYTCIPGFDSIRAVGRFGILVAFGLSVTLSLTTLLLTKKYKLESRTVCVLFAILLAENFHYSFPLEAARPAPAAFQRLSDLSADNHAFIMLPYAGAATPEGTPVSWQAFARYNVNAMHWAFPLKRFLVNGYSGQQTKLMRELPGQLAEFPDERSLLALRSIAGLRYVIVVSSLDPDFNHDSFGIKSRFVASDIRLIEADSAGNYLFELIGEQAVREDFLLSVPSSPAGILNLELRVEGATAGSEAEVAVQINDHFEDPPLTTLSVPADGSSRMYSIPLPRTSDAVRPLRLGFKTAPGSTIFLGKTTFEPVKQ